MTRTELGRQYTTRDGNILDLGKFQSEPLYTPYFWDSGSNGMADEDENGVWFFVISPEDLAEFPELTGMYGVAVEESETGFVTATTYQFKQQYDGGGALSYCQQEEGKT